LTSFLKSLESVVCDILKWQCKKKVKNMDWVQFSIFMCAMATFFITSRNDTKSMLGIVLAIKDEIKDFHGRLCAIEEKNKTK